MFKIFLVGNPIRSRITWEDINKIDLTEVEFLDCRLDSDDLL